MHKLFEKTKSLGLYAGACKACATNLGALEAVKKEGLALLDDMHGHPAWPGTWTRATGSSRSNRTSRR
jgi:hypothetical protein